MKKRSHNQTQRVKKFQNGPLYLSGQKNAGGQLKEGNGVVHHVQEEHHQTYLLHHYQNGSIQDIQIQCRKDQIQIDKDMVEQSNTVPLSIYK